MRRFAFVLLIMSVELINDCVVLPESVNWKDRVAWSRRWDTQIVPGVTGGEERSSGRVAPLQTLEYSVTTFSIPERARLNARILAGLKSGRAVCPFWGRGQQISVPEPQPWEDSGAGNTAIVSGLIPGQIYWYEKGQWDTSLVQSVGDELTESGYFCARFDSVLINMTSALTPGTVTPVLARSIATDGEWPWTPGQWAFFVRPFSARTPNVTFENRDLFIDCGQLSSTPAPWHLDSIGSGGAAYSPGAPSIDTTRVKGWATAPQAVYQSARNLTAAATPLAYEDWGVVGNTYRVLGLAVGQKYFYRKGAFDNRLYCGAIELTASGTFVATDTVAFIEMVSMVTPGTVEPASFISYQIEGLITGVECSVRLHFAELESGFDGSTKRRQFHVSVIGEDSFRRANFEPYAAAGDNMNAAVTVDFVVRPDPRGIVTIVLEPIAPDFCSGVNALEVVQRTWEVVQLIEGAGDNLIVCSTPLRGYYPPGSLVYPAFFGKLGVQRKQALSGMHADLRLVLSEPLGSGELGANNCPAEVCIPDPIIDPVPPLVLPNYLDEPLPGGTTWGPLVPRYFDENEPVSRHLGIDLDAVGTDDPAEQLSGGVLEAWAGYVWAQWQLYKAEAGINPTAEKLFWEFTSLDGTLSWYADGVFASNSWGSADYRVELVVNYTT